MNFCVCFCLDGPKVQCYLSEYLDIREGETLERGCHVTGRPSPTVRWMKAGRPADPNAPLSRSDAGRYTLEAEGATFIRKELSIQVLCECHIRSSAQTRGGQLFPTDS